MIRGGNAVEGIAAARRFVEDASATRHVMERWQREVALAEVFAYLNRPAECVELLAKLLRVPCGFTVPLLRADPTWDNVREDARFRALLTDPKNAAPL